jgi:hypothetical protein
MHTIVIRHSIFPASEIPVAFITWSDRIDRKIALECI